MKLSTLKLAVAAAVLTASSAVAAPLGWDAYAIRGLPTINETYGGDADAVQFIVNGSDAVFGGSAKAGSARTT